MSRKFQYSTPTENMQERIVIPISGAAGTSQTLNFIDGSIRYYGKQLNHAFSYILIDNIGDGSIRVALDMPNIDMSTSVNGSKTLLSRDTMHIYDPISTISIYFVATSTVEIVGFSDKDGN
jgi:hypothetical protein